MLRDDAVAAAVRRRKPFVIAAPNSSASHSIAQLAMRLETGMAGKASGPGFFNRMSRWFRK
jgi:MinD-like ATPase involved in chromosome partitioning or flagellar assembly